ncbi:MAG: hypothetical protein Q4D92_00965 [Slackia sp.]|nr:hypothetical protein [Slackia sp.]
MAKLMKDMARPYAVLFAIALVIAVLARAGLMIMDMTGTLAYDYISASGVAILDVVCSILTGSAFIAFIFAGSLALALSTAGVVLYGYLTRKGALPAHPATAFLWGWATAFAAIVCLLIVASGILSGVQVASMSSKLPGAAALVAAVVVFAAFIATLLGAASLVVHACVMRSNSSCLLAKNLLIAVAVCGVVVMLLTVGTFASINMAAIDGMRVLSWLAVDVVANVAMMVCAWRLAKGAHPIKA